MDVRMPDGTIIKNVPEGTTKVQLQAKLSGQAPDLSDIREQQQEILERFEDPLGTAISGEVGTGKTLGQLATEEAPLIGATVGSLLFPPAAVPAVASKLPLLARAIPGLKRVAPTILAGGIGGGIGGAAREASRPEATLPSIAREALTSAEEMGLAETAGLGVFKVLKATGKPVVEFLTPGIKKAIKFAKEHDIPISPVEFAKTKTAQVLDFFTEKFVPARLIKDKFFREKAIVNLNNIISELPKTVGRVRGNVATANVVSEQTKTALKTISDNAKNLAEQFIKTLPRKMTATETQKGIKDLLSRVKNPKTIDFLKRFQDQFKGGRISGELLEENFRALGSQLKNVGTDAKLIPGLKKLIEKDFGTAGGNLDLLSEAGQAFVHKFALERLSPIIRQLKAGRLPPNALTARIFAPGNENVVRTLKKLLPKETFNDLAAQNLNNLLIKKFSKASERLGPGVRILDGKKMLDFLAENKSIIKATYGKETTEAIFNLARVAKAGAKDFTRFEKGLGQNIFTGNIAALAGAGFKSPEAVIVTSALAPFITKSLMSTKGILNKALTTGFGGKLRTPVKEGIKLGGRLAFEDTIEN